MLRKILIVAVFAFGIAEVSAWVAQGPLRCCRVIPSGAALLQEDDLTFVGSFKMPADAGVDAWRYGSGTLSFYQDPTYGATLMVSGAWSSGTSSYRDPNMTVAQVTVPGTLSDPFVVGYAGLTAGTTIQGFSAVLSTNIPLNYVHSSVIAYGGKLIGGIHKTYDNDDVSGMFVAPLTWGDVSSSTSVYSTFSHLMPDAGATGTTPMRRPMMVQFFSHVPAAYQAQLGKVIMGTGADSIDGTSTQALGAAMIDADQLIAQPATSTTINTVPLLGQPFGHRCYGTLNDPSLTACGALPPTFLLTDYEGVVEYSPTVFPRAKSVQGMAIIDTSRSLLFTGVQSLGSNCYGPGVATYPFTNPLSTSIASGANAVTFDGGFKVRLPGADTAAIMASDDTRYIWLSEQTTPVYLYAEQSGQSRGTGQQDHLGVSFIIAHDAANSGTADANITVFEAFPDGQTSQDYAVANHINCYDPVSADQGGHDYPYTSVMYAIDMNDILAVKAGTKDPWEVFPYAAWNIGPLYGYNGTQNLGMTWDAATRRLYFYPGGYGDPMVHVYSVAVPTAPAPQPAAFPVLPLTAMSAALAGSALTRRRVTIFATNRVK